MAGVGGIALGGPAASRPSGKHPVQTKQSSVEIEGIPTEIVWSK